MKWYGRWTVENGSSAVRLPTGYDGYACVVVILLKPVFWKEVPPAIPGRS